MPLGFFERFKLQRTEAPISSSTAATQKANQLRVYDAFSVTVDMPLSNSTFPELELLEGLILRWNGMVKGRLPRAYGAEQVVLIEDTPPSLVALIRPGMVHFRADEKAPLPRLERATEAVFDLAAANKIKVERSSVKITGIKKQPDLPVVDVVSELMRPYEKLADYFRSPDSGLVLDAMAPYFFMSNTNNEPLRFRKVLVTPSMEDVPGLCVELTSSIYAPQNSSHFMELLREDLQMFRYLSPTLPVAISPALVQLWK